MKIICGLSALLLGTTLLGGAAAAQGNDWHAMHPQGHPPMHGAPPPGAHAMPSHWNKGYDFHDRNVAHFSAQDRTIWTQGRWRHTNHNGRNGWWWYTDGAWFFYDQPVYPYPGYVSEDYSVDDGDDGYAAPYQGGYVWYYCNNPAGYYPYIQSCRGPWEPVQPTPPGYENQTPQGAPDMNQGPDMNQNEDQGPPDQYQGQPPGPQQGYDNSDQGPPPGYNGEQGPPPGYDGDQDQGPPPGYNNGDQGPPPGYGDQPPPR